MQLRRLNSAVVLLLFAMVCVASSQEEIGVRSQSDGSAGNHSIEANVPDSRSAPKMSKVLAVETAEEIIAIRSRQVLETIKKGDIDRLSALVHPEKGVLFSPYAYVDPEQDVVIATDRLKSLWDSSAKRVWGAFDGSGEPIEGTLREYFQEFVYDADFLNAERVGYNTVIGQGNTINNVRELYPVAIIVEYHFSGFEPDFGGMDWKSLRLVFEEVAGTWYLVAVIHDQWTS